MIFDESKFVGGYDDYIKLIINLLEELFDKENINYIEIKKYFKDYKEICNFINQKKNKKLTKKIESKIKNKYS